MAPDFHQETPMTLQRLTPLICCALFAACGTQQPAATPTKAPTIAAAMADADAELLAGRSNEAYAILKRAGAAFPKDKTPLVRMAQMRFDSTDYGQAIVDAQQALQRDPNDTLANSIVAVSGLRVTSKALADLSQKNNLTGNVRTEAQELAKLLRANLNESDLGGNRGLTVRKDPIKKAIGAAAAAAAPPAVRPAVSDPFGALK
jgi:predicted Zn-dependent protease